MTESSLLPAAAAAAASTRDASVPCRARGVLTAAAAAAAARLSSWQVNSLQL